MSHSFPRAHYLCISPFKMMKKRSIEELNRLSVSEFKKAEKNPFILILDNIRSLNNIGSIFRTADAFRVSHIYLCGITARPPHREIRKTALGSTESVDWTYTEDVREAIKKARKEGFVILSLEQTRDGIYLNDYHPEPGAKVALILGNEVQGVSEDAIRLSDHCIEIPQFGHKHSFNVTISNGIALWDLLQKMKSDLK